MRSPAFRRPRLEPLEKRLALSAYFVSTTGSDAAAGTDAAPWRTLQFAATRVNPGDSVTVRPGTYAGFDLQRSGTAGSPITFHADPGVLINSPNPRTGDGINLEGADYIIIEGFKVTGQPRAGIRSVVNQNAIIRNNWTDANGVWGIFTGFSEAVVIENNQTSNSADEHGIYVSNSADNPIIRGNTSWGNRAAGIHMNGDVSQGGDGIISNALVENNVIFENGVGGASGINCDGVQSSRFQNNLLYDNHASGMSLYRIDGGGPSSNNIVVNNTIINASNGRWVMNIQNASTGNQLFNNILYNNHASRGSIDISSDSLPALVSDYNVVMNRFTTNGGTTIQNLASWRTNTGQDMHSLVATPAQLFVNVAADDYHLSSTSPAINAGTSTQAPPSDYEGDSRPSGTAWDIGADEFMAAPPAALILDDFDAPSATGSVSFTSGWATAGGSGLGRNGNLHLDYNESFLPPQIATYTFNVPATGSYRVSATWNVNPSQWSPATRFEVSDGSTVLGTALMNQAQAPNDFSDAGSSWEDLGQFDITGSTGMQLKVRILSGTDDKYTIADAIRIEKVAELSPAAEINVIMNGEHGATINDNTGTGDFGTTNFNVPVQRTFTISNQGTASLNLTTPVTVTGGAFTIVSQPAATVAPGSSTTLVVQMSGAVAGPHSGTISFATNDSNENPFNFALSGTVRTYNIIDDGDPGFVSSPVPAQPGGWGQVGGPGRGFDYQFNRDNPGVGPEFATWTFNVTPGQYRVSTTWAFPAGYFDAAAPFTIFDGGVGGAVVGGRYIDQKNSGPNDTDYPTGFEFPLGTSGSQNWERVDIVNITGNTLTVQLLALDPQVFVVADSILIDRLGGIPSGPEVVITESNRNVAGAALDYGRVQLNQSVDKTFTIRNTGNATLNITTPVTIGGANSNAFTVLSQPTLTAIPVGGSTSFVVRMTASHPGVKNATINFGTNDADEGVISLPITGHVESFFISDDQDAGYSQVGMSHQPNIGIAYRNDFSLANTSDVQGPANATWTFNTMTPGDYYVALTWFDAGGDTLWASNTQLIIKDGTLEVANFRFNQRNGQTPNSFLLDGARWQIMAFFSVTSPTLTVMLTNINTDGLIMADGVLVNRIGGSIPPGNSESDSIGSGTTMTHISASSGAPELRPQESDAVDAAFLSTAFWQDDLEEMAVTLATDSSRNELRQEPIANATDEVETDEDSFPELLNAVA